LVGEISQLSGAAVEAPPSPAVATSNRFGIQQPDVGSVLDKTAPAKETDTGGLQDGSPNKKTPLASMVAHARSVELGNNATITFERDHQDGKMYVHVKDKSTGKELFRIPENYLKSADPQKR
jgi:uncharacterized FlaG/YvyC family protein